MEAASYQQRSVVFHKTVTFQKLTLGYAEPNFWLYCKPAHINLRNCNLILRDLFYSDPRNVLIKRIIFC